MKYTELELIILFLVVLSDHCKLMSYKLKTPFKTKILVDKNKSVIHSYKNKNKKALIFLTGGSQLEFSYYIKKLVDDLIFYQNIHQEYDIFVFENTHEINFLCISYISNWIKEYICPEYPNIIICGLSNGGCIGSKVVTNIIQNDEIKSKFKLITIDTIFDMADFLKTIEKNIFFRIDIFIAYAFVLCNSIKHTHLKSNISFMDFFNVKDYKSFLISIEKMYGINQKSFEETSKINFNIDEKCDIINIYSINDPITDTKINEKYYKKQQLQNKVQSNIKNIPFDIVSHNTQMVTEKLPKNFVNYSQNV